MRTTALTLRRSSQALESHGEVQFYTGKEVEKKTFRMKLAPLARPAVKILIDANRVGSIAININ